MPCGLRPAVDGLSSGGSFCFLDLSSQSARSGNGRDGLCVFLLEGLLLGMDADRLSPRTEGARARPVLHSGIYSMEESSRSHGTPCLGRNELPHFGSFYSLELNI